MELNTKAATEKLNKFKPYVAGLELLNSCLFNCNFCINNSKTKDILPLDEFKKRVQTLIHNGIRVIDITPTYKGDVFLISNISDYIQYLEDTPEIESYFFYFSMVPTKKVFNIIDNILNIINDSTKATLLFSCYWTDNKYETFEKITHTSKKHFEIHKINTMYLFKKINADRIIFVNRLQRDVTERNPLLMICKARGIEMIREDDDVPLHITDDHKGLCDQYLNCTFVTIDGNLHFCNFGYKSETIIGNIDDYTNRTDFIQQMTSNKHLNNNMCNKCEFYNPLKDQSWDGFINNYSYLGYENL